MHKNIGRLKEDEFVFAINGKRAEDLSHNFKHILREMFGLFDGKEIIKCGLVEKLQKPDFYIEYIVARNIRLAFQFAVVEELNFNALAVVEFG